jgi:hypothetical protein
MRKQRGKASVDNGMIAAIRISGNDLVNTQIKKDQIRSRPNERIDLKKSNPM